MMRLASSLGGTAPALGGGAWITLALVLASTAVACGDDDDTEDGAKDAGEQDAGPNAGGSTAGSGGRGGMDAGPVVEAGRGPTGLPLCLVAIDEATSGMVNDEFAMCVCENNVSEDVENCSSECWQLMQCEAAKCPSRVGEHDDACLAEMCADYLGAADEAAAVNLRPCLEPPLIDPEQDAGFELDAGSELDAGH